MSSPTRETFHRRLNTPLGQLRLSVSPNPQGVDTFVVSSLVFGDDFNEGVQHSTSRDGAYVDVPPAASRLLDAAAKQLTEYFAHQRESFDLPLAPVGTPFQQAVWRSLQQIPYGQTWSYADVAKHIGKPTAVRAVGAANGRNPIAILVPCHRVIGKTGNMTGYAWGLDCKKALLALEGA